jgi:hypothetical protein
MKNSDKALVQQMLREIGQVVAKYGAELDLAAPPIGIPGGGGLVETIAKKCRTPNGHTQWKFIRLGLRTKMGGRMRNQTPYARQQAAMWADRALEATGAIPEQIIAAMDMRRLGMGTGRRAA